MYAFFEMQLARLLNTKYVLFGLIETFRFKTIENTISKYFNYSALKFLLTVPFLLSMVRRVLWQVSQG